MTAGRIGFLWMLVVGLIAPLPERAWAVTSADAEAYISRLGNRTLDILSDDDRSVQRMANDVRPIITENLDMDTISRLVLGRYWRTATDAQRSEFKTLLSEYVVSWFAAVLSKYSGEKLVIRSSRPEGDGAMLVFSLIERPNGPPARVDWRVMNGNGGQRIYDVMVEGVSMALTYQQEFSSVIQNNGGRIEALMDALRKRTVRTQP